tara:strand:+ start:143 stop:391 length:249 start_codon:yes stop_codon:yes gene_type:complete
MNYYESRIWGLEAKVQDLQQTISLLKLEALKNKVVDPLFNKPLSEINVNYEIVEPDNVDDLILSKMSIQAHKLGYSLKFKKL